MRDERVQNGLSSLVPSERVGAPEAPDVVARRLVSERPSFHSAGGDPRVWNALPGTLDLIGRLVRPGDSTLETGSGASTVVFAAAGARHLAISPQGEEHNRIRAYCEQVGVAPDELEFIEGFSADVLPALDGERRLDVAFIDGAHSFPLPVVDWHFVSRLLRVGGILIMDDVPIPAVAVLFRYMRSDSAWELLEVVDDRAAAFRKLSEPPPGDDWRLQEFNRGYPDYRFLSLSSRAGAEIRFRRAALRRVLGRWRRRLQRGD
jgi:hypothetical protein